MTRPPRRLRKPRLTDPGERPADLVFWLGDGCGGTYKARVPAETEVSIGRTNSRRALGFLVKTEKGILADFVLNRDQCAELVAFLGLQAPRLRKPLGRNPNQISLAVMLRGARGERPKTVAPRAAKGGRHDRRALLLSEYERSCLAQFQGEQLTAAPAGRRHLRRNTNMQQEKTNWNARLLEITTEVAKGANPYEMMGRLDDLIRESDEAASKAFLMAWGLDLMCEAISRQREAA